jgi:hypothetical protein
MRLGDARPLKPAPELPSVPEGKAVDHTSGPTNAGLATNAEAPAPAARGKVSFEDQRFQPQPKPGPQGNPEISWPSPPFNAKGRSYDLWGTTDLFGATRHEPIAHTGGPLGAEIGSPTHFQSRRNQLTAASQQAQIAHLTYPQDKGLQKAWQTAKSAELNYAKENKHNIQRELKAGHKDEYVPPREFRPPSLGTGMAGTPVLPEQHHPRPLHRDNLVRLDDMVNKAATAFVNRPGKGTERSYKEALHARTVYEKAHKGEIQREMRTGAWNQTPIGWNHPDYRELRMQDAHTVAESNPVVGNRVYELGVPPSRSESLG